MTNARAKRAKVLFFIVKYANLRHWPRGCLSSLMTTAMATMTSEICIFNENNKTMISARPARAMFYFDMIF